MTRISACLLYTSLGHLAEARVDALDGIGRVHDLAHGTAIVKMCIRDSCKALYDAYNNCAKIFIHDDNTSKL